LFDKNEDKIDFKIYIDQNKTNIIESFYICVIIGHHYHLSSMIYSNSLIKRSIIYDIRFIKREKKRNNHLYTHTIFL